jgi:polysaccharide export outer membrane protein
MKMYGAFFGLFVVTGAFGQVEVSPPKSVQDYKIGPLDVLDVSVYGMPTMSSTVRVSATGAIEYQPIGAITAGGLSETELARKLEEELKKGFLNNPRVNVFIKEFSSQPVSVVGAVKIPGEYQILGQKTLIDMLAKAGDRTETAGSTIQILRGDGTISINSVELFQSGNAALNIPVLAGDKIIVLYAQYITVVGEVKMPGQYPLTRGQNISVIEAWAKAGGGTGTAKKKEAVVLREHPDGKVEELAVNIDKLMARQIPDVEMQPGDVLLVPSSAGRTILSRTLESLISVGVGRAIYIR